MARAIQHCEACLAIPCARCGAAPGDLCDVGTGEHWFHVARVIEAHGGGKIEAPSEAQT